MKLLKIVTIAILLVAAINSYGQYSIPVTSTIRTPQGNIPYTYYVPGIRPYYNYGQGNISAKYKFQIELKNDSTFTAKTRIDISEKGKQFLIIKRKDDKKFNVKPSETKSISRITLDGRKLIGIPADTCWLFKVWSGRINSYSFLAEEGMNYVIAVQEGDGPIEPLNKEVLQGMMWDYPKSLKLIEKGKFVRAIEVYNQQPSRVSK